MRVWQIVEIKKLSDAIQFLQIQWTLPNGITDNGINRLLELDLQVPNYSLIPKVGCNSFAY